MIKVVYSKVLGEQGGGGCAFDCESGLCELKEKKKKERKTLLTIESSCVGPEGGRGMCL